MEDILYNVIRCGLLHEGTIAQHVSFSANVLLGAEGGKYQLADSLPAGLVAAAVVSPLNATQKLTRPQKLSIGRKEFNVDDLWGRCYDVAKMLETGAL